MSYTVQKQVVFGKYFPWLAMLFITVSICDVLLVYRLVNFFGFLITAGVFVMPIYYMLQDVIAEIYGFYTARMLIFVMIVCMFIFSFLLTVAIHLPFPDGWQVHNIQYQFVLGHLFRTNTLGFLSVLVGAFANICLIVKWKRMLQGRFFWLRSLGSSAIGEVLSAAIGSFVLYFHVYSIHEILRLILPVCLLLVGQNFIYSFLGSIVVSILKNKEGEVCSKTVDVNPFFSGQD